MVTVALDVTPLLGAPTGVATLVGGWLSELAADPEVRLSGYGLTWSGRRRLPGALPAGVRRVRWPLPAGLALRVWGRVDLPPIEWVAGSVQVVHGTNFVVPPARHAARVVTVHDLACVRYPELCSPVAQRYPKLIARAVAGGATVHVTSQFVAEEVADHFGVPPDRMAVIAPGVTPESRPPRPARGGGSAGGAPYVLALGTVEPRKDIPVLVEAFDLLAGRHPDVELLIAGPAGWGEAAAGEAVAAARHGDRIRRIGWVDDRDGLLAGAAVLAYPSRYEGFGFPPLEAMAAGIPVVATAAGAIPEVVGDAALLVPVGDPEALAGALEVALTDTEVRQRLSEAGGRRVAGFGWHRAGVAMRDLYLQLAGR